MIRSKAGTVWWAKWTELSVPSYIVLSFLQPYWVWDQSRFDLTIYFWIRLIIFGSSRATGLGHAIIDFDISWICNSSEIREKSEWWSKRSAPTGRASISELDSSYLDQHVLLLVWGVPSLMHHGSQLRSLKTTDWLLTALWLQTFWFHQVNKVIPLYISSHRILPQHLGSHALRFHEFIWNLSKFINLTLLKFRPFVIVWSLCYSVQWPCNVLCILLIISKILQGHWMERCKEQNIWNGLSFHVWKATHQSTPSPWLVHFFRPGKNPHESCH